MAFTVSERTGETGTPGKSGLTPIASNSGDAGWVGDNWTAQWFPRLYTGSGFDSAGDAQRLQMMNQIKTLFDQYKAGTLDRAGYQAGVQQFPWVNRLQWITGNWFNPTQNPPAPPAGGGGTTPPPSGGGSTPTPPAGPPGQGQGTPPGWNQGKASWKQAEMAQLPPGLAARLPKIAEGMDYANERPESFGPNQSWLERLMANRPNEDGGGSPPYQLGKIRWE